MSAALYDDAIVALARSRVGAGHLDPHDMAGDADNPLCGDRIRLELTLKGDAIERIAHETRGCLLTEAAAALLAQTLPGHTVEETEGLHAGIKAWLKGQRDEPPLPELAVFAPVRQVRSRHNCVLIPFEALRAAVKNR